MSSKTPKQIVNEVHPDAFARKNDDGTYTVWSKKHPTEKNEPADGAINLGFNGSANGAWKHAAESLQNPTSPTFEDAIESAALLKTKPEFLTPQDKIASVFDVAVNYRNGAIVVDAIPCGMAPVNLPRRLRGTKKRHAQKVSPPQDANKGVFYNAEQALTLGKFGKPRTKFGVKGRTYRVKRRVRGAGKGLRA